MKGYQYRECAKIGLTQAETARKLGVSREAVSSYAERHGLEFRDGRYADRSRLKNLHEKGLTTIEIAGVLSKHPSTIRRALKSLGLGENGPQKT